MRFLTMLAVLAAYGALVAGCGPAVATPSGSPGATESSAAPTLPFPDTSVKTLASPTIEVPPPID